MTNVAALATMLVLGPLLIPWLGAKGAALATVLGDTFLAAAALVMLVRARQSLKPNLRFGLRILPAGALGVACVLIPALPDLATAAIAAVVYCAAAWILGAVPADAINAFASQWRIGSR